MAGANGYAYCYNDPINFVDPLGLWETDSYWGDAGKFGTGELGALANFGASSLYTGGLTGAASLAFGIKPWHPYSPGCTNAERSGEWFGDQLYAIGEFVAGFASGGGGLGKAAEEEGALARLVNKLKGKGPGCFVAGTLVAMADGSYKPIEQIKPGDMVFARDTTSGTGQTMGKRVEKTSAREVDGTLLITFAGGAQIEATGNHPFFVAGAGFVEADELGIGSEIVTRAGPNLVVKSIEKKSATVPVYNFIVADFHSYFVGNPDLTGGGAWVHNPRLCGDAQSAAIKQGHVAEAAFRKWLEEQGVILEPKAGGNMPGPDAVRADGKDLGWDWAELKASGRGGMNGGSKQIRDRFASGFSGRAARYIWRADGSGGYTFSHKGTWVDGIFRRR